MAKKRRKKKDTGDVAGLLMAAIPFVVIVFVSGLIAGFMIYRFGVWPGVAAGGGAAVFGGMFWLAGVTFGDFPEGTPGHPLAQLAVVFANGIVNIGQCIPQMLTIAAGLLIAVGGIVGWIMAARAGPAAENTAKQGAGGEKRDVNAPKTK